MIYSDKKSTSECLEADEKMSCIAGDYGESSFEGFLY